MTSHTEHEEEILAWRYELRDLLASKMEISPSGCWLWIASKDAYGYSRIKFDCKSKLAHVLSYVSFTLAHVANELDHLCEIKHCINPKHLKDVTHKNNSRKASGWTLIDGIWYCKRKHAMTGMNIYPTSDGYVRCKACMYLHKNKVKTWRSN